MSFKNPAWRKGPVTQEVTQLDPPKEKDKILFCEPGETRLFFHRASALPDGTGSMNEEFGQWCNRAQTLGFLENPLITGKGDHASLSDPSFTLIGGYGNGTFHDLSLDRDLFEQIIKLFRLPDRVREVIRSVHGVFSRFVEYDHGAPRSLQIFCAMRIVPDLASVTCLLFDAQPKDFEGHTAGLIRTCPSGLEWRNPAAFLAMLLKESGRTSEEKREELDLNILKAEIQTKSTPWQDFKEAKNDYYEATGVLNLCHNNLVFVTRAVDAEIEGLRFLRRLTDDEKLGPWMRGTADEGEWVGILDGIDFETAHTVSRRAQIGCLKERIGVQINLISNMIAHQETSQTNLIAILALIFAPAGLIAGIFSAGIFATDDRSWILYVASTVPVTAVTLVAGLGFLKQQDLARVWRGLTEGKGEKKKKGDGVEEVETWSYP
ncbi:hypothetical protein ACHAPT_006129 [Fusarium lateritium]